MTSLMRERSAAQGRSMPKSRPSWAAVVFVQDERGPDALARAGLFDVTAGTSPHPRRSDKTPRPQSPEDAYRPAQADDGRSWSRSASSSPLRRQIAWLTVTASEPPLPALADKSVRMRRFVRDHLQRKNPSISVQTERICETVIGENPAVEVSGDGPGGNEGNVAGPEYGVASVGVDLGFVDCLRV